MKQEYEYSTETSRFSNIGQQFEKAIWFKRTISKYEHEKVMLFLGSRFAFMSVYKNGIALESVLHLSSEQIAEIMDSSTTIADVFEYCRENFCRELAPIKRGAKPAKADDQLDMFGVLA